MKRSESKQSVLTNKNEFLMQPATAATSSTVAAPPWIELPSDLTANILRRLGSVDLLQNAQFVCATWWNHCKDPAMWRVINMVYTGDGNRKLLITMCRQAVDRSQGQVVDLTIDGLVDNELLNYIADRSTELRRLTLARPRCFESVSAAITEAAKKLPNLELLHLVQISGIDIETIGFSCPMLKSFTFDRFMDRPRHIICCNDNALAIAKSMPNLCSLRLFANKLNNEGLQAILDGCPRLESLDLRQCLRVDLRGALGERCREQIKDLRPPFDSLDDYHYISSSECDSYDSDSAWYFEND